MKLCCRSAAFVAAISLSTACLAPQAPPAAAPTVTFAFWNVENLFDTDDDPANPGDDEYLPANGWTPALYRQKLDHLAEVIAAVRPDLLGLAEIENRRVLDDLVSHRELATLGYRIAHRDSPDKRGIDLALAYRAPFEPVAGDEAVRLRPIAMPGQAPTRGVLEVRLRYPIGRAEPARLAVLVNHWPSRGGDRDGAFRRVAGEAVRAVVDRIVAAEEAAGRDGDVLVIGDLNDDPFDPSVQTSLGAIRSRNAVLNRRDVRALYNPSWSLLAEPDVGTLYYNAEWVWNVFDQAILTRGLVDGSGSGFAYVEGSLQVHAPDRLRDRYRRPLRFRKGRDGEWQTGYSDHFMIHGRLELRAGSGR